MSVRPPGQTVSIDKAQELLGVSRRTVYYWISNGKLSTVRTIASHSQRVLIESIWFQKRVKGRSES